MWTKSQKFSAGLLGVAVLAFSVDRWVLSPSSSASGAAVSEYAISPASRSTGSPAATTAVKDNPTPTTTLASRLSAMATAQRYQYVATGDAFRASDAWLAQSATNTAGVQTAGAAAPATSASTAKTDAGSDFSSRHALSAVMTNPAGGMAIVDGKLYEIGQTIDGFKLVKVGAKDATFTGKLATVTLRLPGLIPLASTR